MNSGKKDGLLIRMIVKVADNIISPLGLTVDENFSCVVAKKSSIRLYSGKWDIPEPFYASLFEEEEKEVLFERELTDRKKAYTMFEKLAILSAQRALKDCPQVNPSSERVIFVLSTTKGNIKLLDDTSGFDIERVCLGTTARAISKYFGNPNIPIVVSNACASGVCAQLIASRYLIAGRYDHAIVIGAEEQSKFIVTGFQSLKALSPEECRPFDSARCGLNPGEAAATIIYSNKNKRELTGGEWVLVRGAIRNDANHISGPSRTGEGCFRALGQTILDDDISQMAFISAHGTATIYNDEMESIAIDRAGMIGTPVSSLKGYFGHTMGAAGILETIMSQRALDEGLILGTRGFKSLGVSRPVSISSEHRRTDKKMFVKMLSGFGGCNAALLFNKGEMYADN